MAIRATCGSCNSTFNARNELAGKRVKCPKCKEGMVIPAASKAKPVAAAKAAPKVVDPMEALLAEANIDQVSSGGPICPDCGVNINPGVIICVDCGFNLETGKRMKTARENDEGSVDTGLTDAEKIMRKAEAEIEDVPITADDQDFGDGGDSFVIAGVAAGILGVLVVIALVIVFSMDEVSKYYNSGGISFIASVAMWVGMSIWITLMAFKAKVGHGIACVLTLGLYCIMFGFMQGKTLLLPTIILLVALVIGLLSGLFVSYKGFGAEEARLFLDGVEFLRMAVLK